MEEMQRRVRDQLDEMKRVWQPRLGLESLIPKYDFSHLAVFQRRARSGAGGRNATRVEVLYEHLQDEIAEMKSQLADDEYPVVLLIAGQADPIQVGSISYRNPDLIICDGLDEANQRCRVLAQAGSVQLLVKIVKLEADTPRPSIDFRFAGEKAAGTPGA